MEMSADRFARDSWLSAFDPRVKLLCFLSLAVVIALLDAVVLHHPFQAVREGGGEGEVTDQADGEEHQDHRHRLDVAGPVHALTSFLVIPNSKVSGATRLRNSTTPVVIMASPTPMMAWYTPMVGMDSMASIP